MKEKKLLVSLFLSIQFSIDTIQIEIETDEGDSVGGRKSDFSSPLAVFGKHLHIRMRYTQYYTARIHASLPFKKRK